MQIKQFDGLSESDLEHMRSELCAALGSGHFETKQDERLLTIKPRGRFNDEQQASVREVMPTHAERFGISWNHISLVIKTSAQREADWAVWDGEQKRGKWYRLPADEPLNPLAFQRRGRATRTKDPDAAPSPVLGVVREMVDDGADRIEVAEIISRVMARQKESGSTLSDAQRRSNALRGVKRAISRGKLVKAGASHVRLAP